VPPGVDHNLDVTIRKQPLEAFGDGAGGIVRVLDPQDELNGAAIVLIAKGNKALLKLGLFAAKRLEERESRPRRDGNGLFLGELPQKGCPKKGVSAGCNGGKGKK